MFSFQSVLNDENIKQRQRKEKTLQCCRKIALHILTAYMVYAWSGLKKQSDKHTEIKSFIELAAHNSMQLQRQINSDGACSQAGTPETV